MRRKIKTGFAGLFVLLFVLMLFGCNLGQQSEAETKNACYTFRHGNYSGIIAADGTVIVPPEYQQVRVIYDELSDEIIWLQAVQGSKTSKYTEHGRKQQEIYQYYLFDPKGNLVMEGPDAFIQNVYGDIVLNGQGRLYHWSNGEVLHECVLYIDNTEEGYLLHIGERGMNENDWPTIEETILTNKDFQEILHIDGQGYVLYDNGYLRVYDDETGLSGLFDLNGKEILPCQFSSVQLSVQGDIALTSDDNGCFQIWDLITGLCLKETMIGEGEIRYADREMMVITKKLSTDHANTSDRMVDYQGNVLSKEYDIIFIEDSYDGNVYFSAKEKDDCVLLERTGKELLREDGQGILQLKDGVVIINHYDLEQSAKILDLKGKEIVPSGRYDTLHFTYDENYIIGNRPTSQNLVLYDVLDMKGNLMVEGLKSVEVLDDNLFWVVKGFEEGLMDCSGNWLYQNSIFSAIEEEH